MTRYTKLLRSFARVGGFRPLNPQKKTVMAYAIIRVRNLSKSDIVKTDIHNARLYESGRCPDNIHPELTQLNQHYVTGKGSNLAEAIDNRINECDVKTRKNSVVALEFVIALSGTPDEKTKMRENYSFDGYVSQAVRWLSGRYGPDNIMSVSTHYDESNPHAHIVITPIAAKEIKWKNKRGSGIRMENRLVARDYTGNKELLRKLQDDYYQFARPIAQKMGVELQRGTKAEMQLREYTKETNHKLIELRQKLADLSVYLDEEAVRVAKEKLAEKEAEIMQKSNELQKRIERNWKINSKPDENGIPRWKKGKDFNIGF